MIEISPRRSYALECSKPLLPADFPEIPVADQLFYDGKESELKTLRQVLAQFQTRPHGEIRLLVVNNADQLSELSQNTLLKTVEEPPSKGAVVLAVSSVDSLLPTLRSRLQKAMSGDSPQRTGQGEVISVAALYGKDKQAILNELEQALSGIDATSSLGAYRHNLVSRAIRRLRQNVNLKLTIDWLGLKWNRDLGIE